MISILVKNKGVRKVGRLTEMTQHLVNGWTVGRVGGLFLSHEVKHIYSELHSNDDGELVIAIIV